MQRDNPGCTPSVQEDRGRVGAARSSRTGTAGSWTVRAQAGRKLAIAVTATFPAPWSVAHARARAAAAFQIRPRRAGGLEFASLGPDGTTLARSRLGGPCPCTNRRWQHVLHAGQAELSVTTRCCRWPMPTGRRSRVPTCRTPGGELTVSVISSVPRCSSPSCHKDTASWIRWTLPLQVACHRLCAVSPRAPPEFSAVL